MQIVLAAAGAAIVVAAMAANQTWLDRHFLPSFFVPRGWYVWIENTVRALLALFGVSLAVGCARVARPITRAPGFALRVMAAAILAIAAAEVALRSFQLRPTEWLVATEEPRRQVDPVLGWILAPSHTGRSRVGGREVEYATDAGGCRVPRFDQRVDRVQPSLVFGGESVMFGEGLTWDESIPAQVGALLNVQSANLAVHGYSTDQTYLRLAQELPRFDQPTAVVAIFMTELFGRNLDSDRPHLAPGLVWQPAEHPPRLMALAGLVVPYRRDATVERGIRLTHDVLRAIVQLASARGAMPLIVVPQFGAEDSLQSRLRQRILTDDIPHLLVSLDPDWRLSWDRHPNARAARDIAAAIAARLRPSTAVRVP
jgi:hypothetical protein